MNDWKYLTERERIEAFLPHLETLVYDLDPTGRFTPLALADIGYAALVRASSRWRDGGALDFPELVRAYITGDLARAAQSEAFESASERALALMEQAGGQR